jgi:DNA-binding GntR family transcriptional regulator
MNVTERSDGATLATAVYAALRRDILGAVYLPGQRLKLRALAARHGVGLAPVREALNRLTSEALVVQSDQRGFAVTPASERDLDDLLTARRWLNELALRQSIARGDAAWEEDVLLAFHRLSRLPRFSPGEPPAANPAWEAAHAGFHEAILAACGSDWLIGFCRQLFNAAERYRHIARFSAANERAPAALDEHRAIMEATIAREADRAVELLVAHFDRTAAIVRHALAAQDGAG